jgi:hypothetical protein
MVRDVQRTAEGTTYVIRPLAPEDTDEKLTAEGRYFNPTTNTWEFPRGLEDVEVQGAAPEMLPMVRPAQQEGNLLDQAVAGMRQNPVIGPIASTVAGVSRGLYRTGAGVLGLAGQGVRLLPGGEGVGSGMVNTARGISAFADEQNAPFRENYMNFNQLGSFGGEVVGAGGVVGGAGRAISASGRALPGVTGRVTEGFGRSVAAGGFTPSAVGRPVAGAAPDMGARLGKLAMRGAGGATAGALGTAVVAPEGGNGGMLGMTDTEAGAAIGALLPTVAARPAKYVLNQLMNGYQALANELGAARAGEIVRRSLGVDLDVAMNALRDAPEGITAQQALSEAGVPADAFMAVGEVARAADPRAFRVISDAQEAARQGRLTPAQGAVQAAETAGDAAAARVQQQQFRTMQAGEQMVGEAQGAARAVPREGAAALEDLRVGAEEAAGFYTAGRAQAQRAIDEMAGGTNLTAARTSEAAAKQALRDATAPMRAELLAAADASGALDIAPITTRLMQMADATGVSPTNRPVLARVAAELDAMAARRGGTASAEDVYAFRKDLQSVVAKALNEGGGDMPSSAAQRAIVVRDAQLLIDKQLEDAIRAAGGPEWQAYLDTYSAGMRALERQEMMGVAGWMLRQNPASFQNLLRGESPDAVAGIFGRGRIDLAETLEPEQLTALRNAASVLDQEADIAGRFTSQTAETTRGTARAKTDADIALEAARARAAQEAAAANAMAGDVTAQNAMAIARAQGDLSAVQGVNEAELARDRRVGVMAQQGAGVARELLNRPRSFINRAASRAALRMPLESAAVRFADMLMEARVAPQIREALSTGYQSGASMMELLAMVPNADRAQMRRNMMNPAFWAHLQAGAVNAMTGNGEQPNAMSPAPQ